MSPALNGSSAIWCSNRLCNGITFNFYTGLSHILLGYVWSKLDDGAFSFSSPQTLRKHHLFVVFVSGTAEVNFCSSWTQYY